MPGRSDQSKSLFPHKHAQRAAKLLVLLDKEYNLERRTTLGTCAFVVCARATRVFVNVCVASRCRLLKKP